MARSVPGATSDGNEEPLAQLRDLVSSAFLDGQLDRELLLGALNLGDVHPHGKVDYLHTTDVHGLQIRGAKK